jgi:hypothetical protein
MTELYTNERPRRSVGSAHRRSGPVTLTGRWWIVALAGWVGVAWVGSAAGCGSVRHFGAPVPSEGTRGELVGDWDDVVASVDAASGRSEVAIEAVEEDGADRKVLRMRTIGDEPGRVTVTREPGPDPVRCVMEVRLGTFGDARREAALLADTRLRLGQLKGREYAPLPGDW